MTRIIISAVVIGIVIILVAGTNIIETKDRDLIQVAASGDLRMVRFFLEMGADVNAKNKDGKTALREASWRSDNEMVNLLKAYGAK